MERELNQMMRVLPRRDACGMNRSHRKRRGVQCNWRLNGDRRGVRRSAEEPTLLAQKLVSYIFGVLPEMKNFSCRDLRRIDISIGLNNFIDQLMNGLGRRFLVRILRA